MSGIPAGAGSLIGKRLGKYEILALLALGGTAEIYLARIGGHAGFEKYVVVKCLHDHLADDAEFVQMFLDEARLAAHLDHSNIVQTFELGEHDNRYYMVMEFLAGLSLAMIVRRATERLPGGKLPVPLILNMIAQACAGLHYAHDRAVNGKALNIVHRDISPQNLVVSFEGVVKVVDFGIAKAEMRETRTRSGTIKGKFAYMSPEQCVANNVDRRTDVFALGVIAHELLTGKRLFKRNSPYDTYQAVIECKIAAPSATNHELDPGIDPIIMRALAKDKDARYPTAEAFGEALAGYLHHRGKGSGGGEVARFFEASFAQEIDDHAARMRELISGRELAAEGGSWPGSDPGPAGAGASTSGLRGVTRAERPGKISIVDDSADDALDPGASDSSLAEALDNLGVPPPQWNQRLARDRDPAREPDDLLADRTRIEANPLELVGDAALRSSPLITERPSGMPQSEPLPAPPLPPPATGERFPRLANLPTMLAASTPEPVVGTRGAQEATAIAAPVVLDVAPVDRSTMRHLPPPEAPPAPPAPPGVDSLYPVVPRANFGDDTAPSEYYDRPSQPLPMLAHEDPALAAARLAAEVDPARGAALMSPVGDGVGGELANIDWDAAAAQPAKAIPNWVLALLFIGALGGALGITVVIAHLVR